MGDNRLKGQEITVMVNRGGVLEDELNEVNNFTFNDLLEVISKGYLGRKTEEKDMIFKGVDGTFNLDIAAASWFRFRQAVIDKAQNLNETEINIGGVFEFPDSGDVVTLTFGNVSFGQLAHNAGARADYVSVAVPFSCSEAKASFG